MKLLRGEMTLLLLELRGSKLEHSGFGQSPYLLLLCFKFLTKKGVR